MSTDKYFVVVYGTPPIIIGDYQPYSGYMIYADSPEDAEERVINDLNEIYLHRGRTFKVVDGIQNPERRIEFWSSHIEEDVKFALAGVYTAYSEIKHIYTCLSKVTDVFPEYMTSYLDTCMSNPHASLYKAKTYTAYLALQAFRYFDEIGMGVYVR